MKFEVKIIDNDNVKLTIPNILNIMQSGELRVLLWEFEHLLNFLEERQVQEWVENYYKDKEQNSEWPIR
jgi:hypothetical protein